MLREWFIQQRLGIAIGAATTAAAALVYATGWSQRLELQFYDALVRGFSTIPASDRIVHIDIDDDALQRYQSWPWPRDTQGALLTILHELGAERTVVDLVWTEPRGGELRTPTLDAYADLEGDIEQLGELSAENLVHPDDELAYAARNAGPVYLSFYYDAQDRSMAADSLSRRAADLLRQDYSLTAEDLSQRLGCAESDVQAVLAGVKRSVAQELVAERLKGDSGLTARQIHENLLKTPFDRPTADREDILAAYYRELGLQHLRRLCPPVPDSLKGHLPVVHRVTPPLYKLLTGRPRLGFVNFDMASDADGTLRRIPLLVDFDGHLVEQLAFAAARDALGIRPEDLSIDERGRLVLRQKGGTATARIQLDGQGRALINWHAQAGTWHDCFTHLPVARLLQILDIRESTRANEKLRIARSGQIVRLIQPEAAFEDYRQKVSQWLEARRAVHRAQLDGRADSADVRRAEADAADLRAQLDREHESTLQLIRDTWSELQKEPDPNDPEIADDYRRFKEAHRLANETIPEIDAMNRGLRAQEADLLDQLRPVIAGKTCFVGYTATAVADMVTAPPYDRMPGVMIHSQLFNSLLQSRFRTWSPTAQGLTVLALLGLAVTAASTLRGPRASLLFVLGGIVLALLANAYGLFGRYDHWLPLLTALVLMFVSWALIVMIRYLVTDRQRRRFSRAVAQYVSPAMARRIAESGQNLSFAPVDAIVTCLFSDIAGFTTLSEELGPAGTRAVLNPYLEVMSGVLHRRRALINKFMGDGVFAFFNPPILPCRDHEAAACEAALDSRIALGELAPRHADTPLASYFQRLSMRIGIASGPVFVGDFGSQDKLDYTCMGDVVNLAARLESANKQFGTAIIVSGPTRDATHDRFAYRFLGAVQVKGKTRGVGVYELLGRHGEVDGDLLEYAERFEQAVIAFSRREFERAASAFQECLRCRPADVASRRYLPAIELFRNHPPDPDWAGSIELTEK